MQPTSFPLVFSCGEDNPPPGSYGVASGGAGVEPATWPLHHFAAGRGSGIDGRLVAEGVPNGMVPCGFVRNYLLFRGIGIFVVIDALKHRLVLM